MSDVVFDEEPGYRSMSMTPQSAAQTPENKDLAGKLVKWKIAKSRTVAEWLLIFLVAVFIALAIALTVFTQSARSPVGSTQMQIYVAQMKARQSNAR